MTFDLTPLRLVWLICALVGSGLAVLHGTAGLPASGSERMAGLVVIVWCVAETLVRRNWLALVTVPALLLGVGCALPLYLFLRSRPVV